MLKTVAALPGTGGNAFSRRCKRGADGQIEGCAERKKDGRRFERPPSLNPGPTGICFNSEIIKSEGGKAIRGIDRSGSEIVDSRQTISAPARIRSGPPREGEGAMPTEFPDSKVLKGLQKKVEEEITRKEIESLLYWKAELEKVTARHSDNLAALRLEIQNFLQRMQNRIKILKGNLTG